MSQGGDKTGHPGKILGQLWQTVCANARHFVHQVDLVRTQVSSEPRFWTHAHALQLFIMHKTLIINVAMRKEIEELASDQVEQNYFGLCLEVTITLTS